MSDASALNGLTYHFIVCLVIAGVCGQYEHELRNITEGHLHSRLADLNTIVSKNNRWPEHGGSPTVWYTYGNDVNVMKTYLEWRLQGWSRDTCLVFKEMEWECKKQTPLDHGVINIGVLRRGCCFADTGYRFGTKDELGYHKGTNFGAQEKCQYLCADSMLCNRDGPGWLLAFSLGLISPLQRPDRDEFVAVHSELMGIYMWPPLDVTHVFWWTVFIKCDKKLVASDVPVPFDYAAMTMPPASYTGDYRDKPAVVTTKDPALQYILKQKEGCPFRGHMDNYQINKAYKCDMKFAKACVASGKTPPKCKHYGYLKRDCTCACQDEYTGATCETKVSRQSQGSPSLCYDNYRVLRITKADTYAVKDLNMVAMPQDKIHYLKRETYAQFLTVVVDIPNTERHVNLIMTHPSLANDVKNSSDIVIMKMECELMTLYWGANRFHKVRSECLSTVLNSIRSDPYSFRSRLRGKFDLTFESKMGLLHRISQGSVDALLFDFTVTTYEVMKSTYKDKQSAGPNGTNITTVGNGTASASRADIEVADVGGLATIGVLGVILLAGFVGLAVWRWRSVNDDDEDDEGVSEEEIVNKEDHSESSNDSDGRGSDTIDAGDD